MRIVVVGAGAVGSYIAERLSIEGQDVVVIDIDPRRAEELRQRIDALVIVGNGASSTTLEEADIGQAQVLLAVTSSDGANIMACHTAKKMGVERAIARVQDTELRVGLDGIGVDTVIDPVETAAKEITTLVLESGLSELIELGDGQLALVGGTVTSASPLVGVALKNVPPRQNFSWLAIAVVRNGKTVVAHGDTMVEEGDHLLLMVKKKNVHRAKAMIGIRYQDIRRVLIIGTTRVAQLTTRTLVKAGMEVVVIDPDEARCRQVAEAISSALVISADPTAPPVFTARPLNQNDSVVALTGLDSMNLIPCLVAKAMGAATTISRVTRMNYVGLLAGIGVDTTVSTRLAAAASILQFVRRGEVFSVTTFSDTDAEVIELEVQPGSQALGRSLLELPLPIGMVIGGMVRGDIAFVPSGSTTIEAHDILIIFTVPDAREAVELMFAA